MGGAIFGSPGMSRISLLNEELFKTQPNPQNHNGYVERSDLELGIQNPELPAEF